MCNIKQTLSLPSLLPPSLYSQLSPDRVMGITPPCETAVVASWVCYCFCYLFTVWVQPRWADGLVRLVLVIRCGSADGGSVPLAGWLTPGWLVDPRLGLVCGRDTRCLLGLHLFYVRDEPNAQPPPLHAV